MAEPALHALYIVPADGSARDNSIATLLNSKIAVFGQSSDGSSIFCQDGIPRKTMYALERPANSMMIAVRQNPDADLAFRDRKGRPGIAGISITAVIQRWQAAVRQVPFVVLQLT